MLSGKYFTCQYVLYGIPRTTTVQFDVVHHLSHERKAINFFFLRTSNILGGW